MGNGADIGIDLGTASILVFIKDKGIVLNEPSVVAIDTDTNLIKAVGVEAQKMLGRTPGNIVAIKPIREGVISDYTITQTMLKYFIEKAMGKRRIFKPRVVICVPSNVTEVERRAVIDAGNHAGARSTRIIEEPIAAAIGAGIDIGKPEGSMIVDIGGGTTDIAVISLGGIVVSTSVKVAGDSFDDAIIRYIRKKYGVLIGERTAEEAKMAIGTAFPLKQNLEMDIKGRNLVTGLPNILTIDSSEVLMALENELKAIADGVHFVLEKTPPELAADISEKAIILTGGGSLLRGMDVMLARRTNVAVEVAEDAISCVAIGTGKSLKFMEIIDRSNGKRKRD